MLIAVIDTNVWVSIFLKPRGYAAQLLKPWLAGQLEVVISEPLVAELTEVLSRPRLQAKRRYPRARADAYVNAIRRRATLLSITGALRLCRDPDDDVVLETAITGRATHVVSRDEDIARDTGLFEQLKQRGIEPITVARFLRVLGAG
jgi:putative PIN family toxin of toxin-antitoxin system